jgi:hypothetical protein
MRLALRFSAARAGFCSLASLALTCSSAFADGAFIPQAVGSLKDPGIAMPVLPNAPAANAPTWAPRGGSTRALPELATPPSGGNFASTLEIGSYNKVFQGQAGAGNVSNVAVIKGYANSVGVLQAGHNLRSNLALVNTQGLAVGVIQPNGSAPVNMLIARLPNGALLIKR